MTMFTMPVTTECIVSKKVDGEFWHESLEKKVR